MKFTADELTVLNKKLAFGRMKNGEVDLDEFSRMVDLFLENGFNYFDTAHGYSSIIWIMMTRQWRVESAMKYAVNLGNRFWSWNR